MFSFNRYQLLFISYLLKCLFVCVSPAVATIMVSKVGMISPGIMYVIVALIALIGLYTAPPELDDPDHDESISQHHDNNSSSSLDIPQIT